MTGRLSGTLEQIVRRRTRVPSGRECERRPACVDQAVRAVPAGQPGQVAPGTGPMVRAVRPASGRRRRRRRGRPRGAAA